MPGDLAFPVPCAAPLHSVEEGLVQKDSPFVGSKRFGMCLMESRGEDPGVARMASIGTVLEVVDFAHVQVCCGAVGCVCVCWGGGGGAGHGVHGAGRAAQVGRSRVLAASAAWVLLGGWHWGPMAGGVVRARQNREWRCGWVGPCSW